MAVGVGYFPASRFPLWGAGLVLFGLVMCQIISSVMDHEQFFPHSSIYRCAKHAPEYVWFRISTICGATLFLLSWIINSAFFAEVTPGVSIPSGIVSFLGISSAIAQMIAAAVIDTGREKWDWVKESKFIFVTLTVAALVSNTLLNWYARRLNKGVKKTGVQLKLVLTGFLLYLTYQIYIMTDGQSVQRNLAEYGWVVVVLFHYLSMSDDYKKFILDYELTE